MIVSHYNVKMYAFSEATTLTNSDSNILCTLFGQLLFRDWWYAGKFLIFEILSDFLHSECFLYEDFE